MPPRAEAPALAARIAEYLKGYPPFAYLSPSELDRVARTAQVKYFAPQATIFTQGQEPLAHFFIVRKGAVSLLRQDDVMRLVDQLDEGDVFGIRPLIARQRYAVTARATEETLLYGVLIADFEPLIEANAQVGRFLTQSFAAGVRNPLRPEGSGRVLIESEARREAGASGSERRDQLLDLTRVETTRMLVACDPRASIQSAAVQMSRAGVGSVVIVDPLGRPLGVLTDRDLRRMVVTGLYPASEAVAEIMSSPVSTIRPYPSAVEVQLAMVKRRISHLVVTRDGTPGSPALGVITNRDLLLALGNSPAAVIAEIEQAADASELARLRLRGEQWLRPIVDQRGSVYAAAKIMTEINDQISRRAVALAIESLRAEEGREPPERPFCWMSLGSHGRGEQLLRTDQDHAIVFADGPPQTRDEAHDYYVAMADRASATLAAVGYERCVGDMMAGNPLWTLTLGEWRAQLDTWV